MTTVSVLLELMQRTARSHSSILYVPSEAFNCKYSRVIVGPLSEFLECRLLLLSSLGNGQQRHKTLHFGDMFSVHRDFIFCRPSIIDKQQQEAGSDGPSWLSQVTCLHTHSRPISSISFLCMARVRWPTVSRLYFTPKPLNNEVSRCQSNVYSASCLF
jgi:hypothetical protein